MKVDNTTTRPHCHKKAESMHSHPLDSLHTHTKIIFISSPLPHQPTSHPPNMRCHHPGCAFECADGDKKALQKHHREVHLMQSTARRCKGDAGYLSNFSRGGSVERAFQRGKAEAARLACFPFDLGEHDHHEGVRTQFELARKRWLAKFEDPEATPLDFKRLGSKKGMASFGLQLDLDKWGTIRARVMYDALVARYEGDERMRQILADSTAQNVYWQHLERGKPEKQYWGGHRNVLGRMLVYLGRSGGAGEFDMEAIEAVRPVGC